MNIDSTQGLSGSSSSSSASGSSKMGKDEFVKLLMAQLGHQDPTSPMDSEAFVSQLAQFANVELAQSANQRLESLVMAQAASNQMSAATLVGRDVLFKADAVGLKEGADAPIRAHLDGAATKVTAVIKDSTGKVVRTLELGAQPDGDLEQSWDGRDDAGVRLPPGDYKLQLTAADKGGKAIAIDSRGHGRVTGVSFEKGYPELVVNGIHIRLADVVQIDEAKTTP
jgi:flagellar basal-body rod modification protein FlgD